MQKLPNITLIEMASPVRDKINPPLSIQDYRLCLKQIRRYSGPPVCPGLRDACLVAFKDRRLLGIMRVGFPHYPVIEANAPVIFENRVFNPVCKALISTLKREVLSRSRIGAEIIQDMNPAGSFNLLTGILRKSGFKKIGRSLYLSKSLKPESMNSLCGTPVKLVSAAKQGIAHFLRNMIECSQPPLLDSRTQPRCLSLEGGSLIIQDLAGNAVGAVDQYLPNCYSVYRKNTAVGIVVTSSGFVTWLAVRPDARGMGIGRALLVELEHKWIAQGIQRAGLQVMSTNVAAGNLYRSLGYQSHGENITYIWKWSAV